MPAFRHRLTRAQRRQYDRSNRVSSIAVHVSPRLGRAVHLLEIRLAQADQHRTQRLSQIICDELCRALRVPHVRVSVERARPIKKQIEYQGLYTSEDDHQRNRIRVWMFTAKLGQVVAFKTFLRTLLHEVCHHLDYTWLRLQDSFHTDGFFKRESSLVHQVLTHAAEQPHQIKQPAG